VATSALNCEFERLMNALDLSTQAAVKSARISGSVALRTTAM
jgi:hypothetical protein